MSTRKKQSSTPSVVRPLVTGAAGGLLATGVITAAFAAVKALGTSAPAHVIHKTMRRGNMVHAPQTNWAARFAVGASIGMVLEFARRSLIS